MSRTVLLTGATGYLGSHLAHALLVTGYSVVVLKRASSSLRRIETLLPGVVTYDIEELDLSLPFREHGDINAPIPWSRESKRYWRG